MVNSVEVGSRNSSALVLVAMTISTHGAAQLGHGSVVDLLEVGLIAMIQMIAGALTPHITSQKLKQQALQRSKQIQLGICLSVAKQILQRNVATLTVPPSPGPRASRCRGVTRFR